VRTFCLFCVVDHHVSNLTSHHNVKKNLFHISSNIPTFFPWIGWPEGSSQSRGLADQRSISLPPVIASAFSSSLFFDDTSWCSSLTAFVYFHGYVYLSLSQHVRRFSVLLQVPYEMSATSLFRRQNHSGEVVDRSWLCSSPL